MKKAQENPNHIEGVTAPKGEPDWLWMVDLTEGRALEDYQIEAIDFALKRDRSYLRLDAGLGKAVCAACIASIVGAPVVVVTPPFLVENLKSEFSKWSPELVVESLSEKTVRLGETNVLLLPDSIITRPEIKLRLVDFRRMWGEREATIIVDEAHRFKNEKRKRLPALFDEIIPIFDRLIFMSATPMPNRPLELYPLLSRFAPEALQGMDYWEYGRRYCDGKQKVIGWDKIKKQPKKRWDFTGSSNLKELAARVIAPSGRFMLRIKKDRLKLPPRIEEVFVISRTMSPRVMELDRAIAREYSDVNDVMLHEYKRSHGEDVHLGTYRKLLGLEKAAAAAEYLEALLSETDESILVFMIHTEAIEKLSKLMAKYKPFVITGQTPMKLRHQYVKEFQSSGLSRRLVIGNIDAMGVGLTLTKARRVLFPEFSWVPGVNSQAIDRSHRYGQTGSVFAQYMVYKGSIDERVLEANFEKRESMRFI